MKIILFGFADPGVRALSVLIESNLIPLHIFTHPERKEFITNAKLPSLIDAAINYSIPYSEITYSNKGKVSVAVKELCPDLLISVNWRYIFDAETLSVPSICSINLHGSYLPRWRGFCPVTWALLSGDTYTGVTIHKIDEGCDTGEILFQTKINILPNDDVKTLKHRMPLLETDLLKRAISTIDSWDSIAMPQNNSFATFGSQRKPEDGVIDWNMPAINIYNWVRSMTRPLPGAFTTCSVGKLFIWKTMLVDCEIHLPYSIPGEIISFYPNGKHASFPVVQTGDGYLLLLDVTMTSHSESQLSDLIRSNSIFIGLNLYK